MLLVCKVGRRDCTLKRDIILHPDDATAQGISNTRCRGATRCRRCSQRGECGSIHGLMVRTATDSGRQNLQGANQVSANPCGALRWPQCAIQIVAPPAPAKSPLSPQPQCTGTYAVIRCRISSACSSLPWSIEINTPAASSSGHTFVFGVFRYL